MAGFSGAGFTIAGFSSNGVFGNVRRVGDKMLPPESPVTILLSDLLKVSALLHLFPRFRPPITRQAEDVLYVLHAHLPAIRTTNEPPEHQTRLCAHSRVLEDIVWNRGERPTLPDFHRAAHRPAPNGTNTQLIRNSR